MADHGKNRRRSFFERRRQNRGKQKSAMISKRVRAIKAYWRAYWRGEMSEKLLQEFKKESDQ